MSKTNEAPKAGTKGFLLKVLPSKAQLEEAVAANGQCNPTDCWHYVAISTKMISIDPGAKHHVRVDAGHIRLNYRGWRYVADTPRHVKRSLMLFDRGFYEQVHVREYSLRFHRTTKIVKISKERQEQITEALAKRCAVFGRQEKAHNLRARVEGFSGIV
jgi:hypothetical protein